MTTAKTKDKEMALGNVKSKALKEKRKRERTLIQLEMTVEIRTSGPAPIDDGK